MREFPKIGDVFGNGAICVQAKPYNDNPLDDYLVVVLCIFGGQFVTWVYNRQTGGCENGRYCGRDLQAGIRSFEGRGL